MPYCPKCGSEVKNDVKFCNSCGGEIKQPAKPATQPGKSPIAFDSSILKLLPLVSGVLIILFLLVRIVRFDAMGDSASFSIFQLMTEDYEKVVGGFTVFLFVIQALAGLACIGMIGFYLFKYFKGQDAEKIGKLAFTIVIGFCVLMPIILAIANSDVRSNFGVLSSYIDSSFGFKPNWQYYIMLILAIGTRLFGFGNLLDRIMKKTK